MWSLLLGEDRADKAEEREGSDEPEEKAAEAEKTEGEKEDSKTGKQRN